MKRPFYRHFDSTQEAVKAESKTNVAARVGPEIWLALLFIFPKIIAIQPRLQPFFKMPTLGLKLSREGDVRIMTDTTLHKIKRFRQWLVEGDTSAI